MCHYQIQYCYHDQDHYDLYAKDDNFSSLLGCTLLRGCSLLSVTAAGRSRSGRSLSGRSLSRRSLSISGRSSSASGRSLTIAAMIVRICCHLVFSLHS